MHILCYIEYSKILGGRDEAMFGPLLRGSLSLLKYVAASGVIHMGVVRARRAVSAIADDVTSAESGT